MTNQNENAAVSDVTARMRMEASILAGVGGQYVSAATVAKKLREFACSIDAAVSKTEKTTPGNAAVMRMVLRDIVMLSMKVGHAIHGDVACGIIASKAKYALSAPARNCDLYDNWHEAHQAWERLPKDEMGYFVRNGVHECEHAWLFAPAKSEKKGESNGSK